VRDLGPRIDDDTRSGESLGDDDPAARGVRGCGRQATYVESCDRLGYMKTDCTWVLNSHDREDDED
jgi:hypothetical protein